MKEVIEIRAHTTWAKADSRETALKFARLMFCRMTNLNDEAKVYQINERHVRGIRFTLEELRG